ncbi:MAG: MFS transporter [Candidatus Dormibacteraeota bacterium]|nr:MFS transporter [Candidatus Dormibacteraeota bacterium]
MQEALPARGQRMVRVIPVAFLMYTIAFVDRINIGVALPAMSKDLHFSTTIGGLASGIFFVGYLILQIPGGHIAERRSAKWLVFTLLLIWGVFAILTGFVQNVPQLLAVRFLLGLTEGGVWPATLVLLAHWFPQDERARANNLWILCLPVAAAVASPVSGAILASTSNNWRLLFVVEGIPPLVWAAIWALVIRDHPRDAKWLSRDAEEKLEERLRAERESRDRPDLSSYRRALTSGAVWLFIAIYFFSTIPGYGFTTFLPSLLEAHGLSIGTVGLLTALPFAASIVGLIVVGVLSDRIRARRYWIAAPFVVVGVGVLVSVAVSGSLIWMIAILTVAGLGLYAYLGPFWASVDQMIPAGVAGGAMGLINALGNLGGFAGPYAVGALATGTGAFQAGFAFLGVAALIMAALAMLIRVREGRAAREATAPRPAAEQ